MSEQPEAATPVVGAAEVHRRIIELFGAGRREEALALIDPDAIDHRRGASGDHQGVAAWNKSGSTRMTAPGAEGGRRRA